MNSSLEIYRMMLRIRRFEETVRDLRAAGQIIGSVHLAIGQEAVPVGACSVLELDRDAVFATYRGHGWAIACGAPLAQLFAELMGRSTGVNGGRGGSAYFSAPDYGFYGENSIVGAGAPIAVGAALAGRYDRTNRVAVCVFGDGAMNQGSVTEAMNFAAALSLPVIFVCENNRYSELTPIADMVAQPELHRRAAALGIAASRIDGNDPDAVEDAVGDAYARAISGRGPSFVEAMTARLVGHYIGDPEQYRPPGELDEDLEKEPIAVARRQLVSRLGETAVAATERTVDEEVRAAAAIAQADPLPDPETSLEHLYA